jgi:hypothetical protein
MWEELDRARTGDAAARSLQRMLPDEPVADFGATRNERRVIDGAQTSMDGAKRALLPSASAEPASVHTRAPEPDQPLGRASLNRPHLARRRRARS